MNEQISPCISNDAARRTVDWMFSGDTGVSSKTMASIALNVAKRDSFGYMAPSDPADFGRCYRLVMLVPEIIDVFPRIAKKVPKFKPLLDNWDELCAMHEREWPTGRAPELYNRMKELLGETPRVKLAA